MARVLFRRFLATSPHSVLGLPISASKSQVKARYYELAKQTHPDVAAADGAANFVEIQSAFEELLAEIDARSRSSGGRSARGAAGPSAHPRARAAARAAAPRPRTLGEVLCDRLKDEPAAVGAVWSDVVSHELSCTIGMIDDIIGACASHGGMPEALRILRDATARGLLPQDVRSSALVSLLTRCKEEELDVTFEVVDEIREEDRTPEVLAALSATFSQFPSGASF